MHIVNKTLSGHRKYILLNFLLGFLKHALILQNLTLNPRYVTRIYKITLSEQYRYILLSLLVTRPNRTLIFPNFPPKQTFQFDKGQHFLSAAVHTTRSFWSKRYPRGSYRVPPQRASTHKSVGDISEARQSASSLDLCFHNETYPRSPLVSHDSWRNERTKQEREKESKVGKGKKNRRAVHRTVERVHVDDSGEQQWRRRPGKKQLPRVATAQPTFLPFGRVPGALSWLLFSPTVVRYSCYYRPYLHLLVSFLLRFHVLPETRVYLADSTSCPLVPVHRHITMLQF